MQRINYQEAWWEKEVDKHVAKSIPVFIWNNSVNLISGKKKQWGNKILEKNDMSGQVQDQEKHSHWLIQVQLNSYISKKIKFFVLYCWLTMVWEFQGDSKGTLPCIHVSSILPNPSSYPSCHSTWSRVSELYSRSLVVVHFKRSSVYVSIPSCLALPLHPLPAPFPLVTISFVV